jgi:hypothetical protein
MEDLELDTQVLEYFEQHKLVPETTITVLAVAPDGTLTLIADGKTASLGPHLADNLWLRRVS